MRSSVILAAFLATCVAAKRADRYFFYFYAAVEGCNPPSCMPCGAGKGCPTGTECGTWGAEANTCCQVVNFSVKDPVCSQFTSLLENFDFSTDGTAPIATSVGGQCPNIETTQSLVNYMEKGAYACCPLTENFVVKKDISQGVNTDVRCIPDPTIENSNGGGGGSSPEVSSSENAGTPSSTTGSGSPSTSTAQSASAPSTTERETSSSIVPGGNGTPSATNESSPSITGGSGVSSTTTGSPPSSTSNGSSSANGANSVYTMSATLRTIIGVVLIIFHVV
ncbi:hypothetical protein ABW20_dc0100172 [Dactylellina cionopaga]|nr:hypothetical protein ABW20_dc0100172 [Dactylellina cionopaga]